MHNIAPRPTGGQPWELAADDIDRRVVAQYRSRHDRVVQVGLHTFRSRRYFEILSAELLPTGQLVPIRRTSYSAKTFLAFRQAVDALERALREEGLL
jgi:hypothetical protein